MPLVSPILHTTLGARRPDRQGKVRDIYEFGDQLLIVASVARVPARRTSASLLLTPLCAAIGAFVLLGDRLTGPELLGAGLLLLGIAGASGVLDGLGHRMRSLTLSKASPYNPDEITRD